MDVREVMFGQQARALVDDDDNRGLNCRGCLFHRQPAAVCASASVEATRRGMRDCDAVDQFGDVVIYVAVKIDPRQLDFFGE